MWAMLLPLLNGIFGSEGIIGKYIQNKKDIQKAEQDYKLAVLTAQTERVSATIAANAAELTTRLTSTSQSFKQTTFYMLIVPVILTMLFPKYAVTMWSNFELMPLWFQNLFISVYSAIWGLPLIKGGYGAVTAALSDRREYKLEKARINRPAVFDTLRKEIFTQGLTQEQVDDVNKALDEGEK